MISRVEDRVKGIELPDRDWIPKGLGNETWVEKKYRIPKTGR